MTNRLEICVLVCNSYTRIHTHDKFVSKTYVATLEASMDSKHMYEFMTHRVTKHISITQKVHYAKASRQHSLACLSKGTILAHKVVIHSSRHACTWPAHLTFVISRIHADPGQIYKSRTL